MLLRFLQKTHLIINYFLMLINFKNLTVFMKLCNRITTSSIHKLATKKARVGLLEGTAGKGNSRSQEVEAK